MDKILAKELERFYFDENFLKLNNLLKGDPS